ncbi:hypothetical protein DITRI_Ditri07aG0011800 [Diplodiscus trichospermus]
MTPEYAMRGYLTYKADVCCFGVVLLEIVSGKSNTNYRPKEEFVFLLDWAYVQQEQRNLLELVDPGLGSKYSKEEAIQMLSLAFLCTNPSPTLRPSMSSVVSMLEGKIPVQGPIVKRKDVNQDARPQEAQLWIDHGLILQNLSKTSLKKVLQQVGSSKTLENCEEGGHKEKEKMIWDVP